MRLLGGRWGAGVWHRFLPRARIGVRIVTAVVLAMTVVLLAAGAFVYWRVSFALDRQLNEDLGAATATAVRRVAHGRGIERIDPNAVVQVYATDGRLVRSSEADVPTLLSPSDALAATTSVQRREVGRLLPLPDDTPYRVSYRRVSTPDGTAVLAVGLSRSRHDEALRELAGQLVLADLAAVVAAGVVGWAASRAALGPVESYRRAAEAGDDARTRLPVDVGQDDELTRLGTTLNALLAQVEASQRRERQFVADASHELRSPLAVLSAEVEWATHRRRSVDELDQVLSSVQQQVARLTQLTDSLLDLEEIGGTEHPVRQRIDLAALVARGVEPHAATLAALGRKVAVQADPVPVRVEPRWTELALSNLVANAAKHGSGDVSVRASVESGDLVVDVTDEGPGIPSELGRRAFERFARADAARTSPGHGLGLSLVAGVAARHDGRADLIDGGVRLILADCT